MEHYHLTIEKPGYGKIVVIGYENELLFFRQLREALAYDDRLPPWHVKLERETREVMP